MKDVAETEEKTAETEYNRIKLTSAYLPALSNGTYRALLKQEVKKPEQDMLPETELSFFAGTPKFTLRERAVYSVYPAENARGEYSGTLPHVVLSDKTYPWERRNGEEGTPWLALVCLCSGEDFSLISTTIGELLQEKPEELKKKGIYIPPYSYERQTGERKSDSCMILEVGKELCKKVFPRRKELPFLAHGRQVDLHDCADDLISLDGCFSVITANRFPVSDGEPGKKNSAFLISVEECRDILPGGENAGGTEKLEDYERFRFLCLYTWDFESVSDSFAGFRELVENLSPAPLTVMCGEKELPEVLKRGYVPLKHNTRTGEKSVSLYRGPLVPAGVPAEKRKETYTADGELGYDPQYGIFDVSYSAAWQLGRLLVLRNKPMAKAVFQWRRLKKQKTVMALNRNILQEKMSRSGIPGRQEQTGINVTCTDSRQDDVRKRLLDSLAGELGESIAKQELLGPPGDPTGRRKLENMERIS